MTGQNTQRANVADLFFRSAKLFPDKHCIIGKAGEVITFGELAAAVHETAGYYRSKGIGPGDRVLIFIPMGIPLYRCILALFHIGAVAVFTDGWVNKKRLEASCHLVGCKAFIAPRKIRMLALLSQELRKIPIWLSENYIVPSKKAEGHFTKPGDSALITFTTGSTGVPKAANRTHGGLEAQFSALVDKIRQDETDIDMPLLPIVLLLNLGTGVTSVIADFNSRRPADIQPEIIWNQIKQYRVNRLTASPFVVEQLAEANIAGKTSLRIFTGGAPVFPAQAKKMLKGLPGSSID
ncbi:MAG TPA: AMP-binding protein, partial [Bacteroidia bacterium]|nr:AMP-binding protein [Bacteroidia bacterium]